MNIDESRILLDIEESARISFEYFSIANQERLPKKRKTRFHQISKFNKIYHIGYLIFYESIFDHKYIAGISYIPHSIFKDNPRIYNAFINLRRRYDKENS